MSPTRWFPLIFLVSLIGCGQASQLMEDVAEAERREVETQCLKQIVQAMHAHHDGEKCFPPAAIYSADGQPLLSWRVALLAYLPGGQGLYGQFHLNEAWDSPHNSQLVSRIPEIYARLGSATDGTTRVMVFTGEGTPFDGPEPLGFAKIFDGTANTILCVVTAADKSVPWTKPEDLPLNPSNPTGGMGQAGGDFFTAGFFDGSVKHIPWKANPPDLCLLINQHDGQPINEWVFRLPKDQPANAQPVAQPAAPPKPTPPAVVPSLPYPSEVTPPASSDVAGNDPALPPPSTGFPDFDRGRMTPRAGRGPEGFPRGMPGRPQFGPGARGPAGPQGSKDTEVVGGTGGVPFRMGGRPGEAVVGFRFHVSSWAGKQGLALLSPIYANQPTIGPGVVVAKQGYAVGAIQVDADECVRAVRIAFMRIEGDRLDTKDSYVSEWLGTPTGADSTTINGGGAKVLGVHGRRMAILDAVGLVLDETD